MLSKSLVWKYCIAFSILLFGVTFSLRTLADDDGFFKNEISAGYYNKDFMDVNIKHPPSPIFWTATTKVEDGIMLMYQRNIYHTHRHFSINLGASVSGWMRPEHDICAFSAFVNFQFWLLGPAHYFRPYMMYSIAGPTMLTAHHFGRANLGENFIFQDVLGIGAQIGRYHALNLELKLVHYSNGDIFPKNSGFDIPIVFAIGYSFS